jgi:Fe-S cluster assembly protein SufD
MSMNSSLWQSQWQRLGAGSEFRSRAFRHFQESGWPSAKAENWQNLPLEWLKKGWVVEPFDALPMSSVTTEIPAGFDCAVFFNGQFSGAHSRLTGWEIRPISASDYDWQDSVGALYQAFHRSDLHLRAKETAPPLMIVHEQSATGFRFNPTLLRLEIPASVKTQVLETWEYAPEAWTGSLTEVELGAGADVEWVRWQSALDNHFSSHRFRLQENARLNWTGLQADCALARAAVTAELCGPNAVANLRGIGFAQSEQVLDNRVLIRHLAPNTNSQQIFKSVLRDKAKSIFAGRVRIVREAQKSDAKQTHQSLNFHSTAQSITQPELEIFADDVKAAHGATVGRLNDEELFYLQTRGISRADGTHLLARAFVNDIVNQIAAGTIRQSIEGRLDRHIGRFLEAMGGA